MSALPALAAEMPVPELVALILTVTPGLARWYASAQVCACGASRLLPVSSSVAGEAASTAAPEPADWAGRAVLPHAATSAAVPAAATAHSAVVSGRDLSPACATVRPPFPRRPSPAAESTGYAAIVTEGGARGNRQ